MAGNRTKRDVTPGDDDSLSVAVVDAVARHREVDPETLPPLANSVDPDALETLFVHGQDAPDRGPWSITFAYAQTEVTVDSEGQIVVEWI